MDITTKRPRVQLAVRRGIRKVRWSTLSRVDCQTEATRHFGGKMPAELGWPGVGFLWENMIASINCDYWCQYQAVTQYTVAIYLYLA